jgi:hypothetical protein
VSAAVYPADVSPGQTGHAAYHTDHTHDFTAHKALLHPQVLDDFPDVNFGSPPASGRQLLVRDPVSGVITLANDANPSGLYVPTSQLGVPGGVSTLDGSGTVNEPPHAHTHSISVRDNGGTIYQRGKLNVIAGSGNVTDDAANDQVSINITSKDVRLKTLSADQTSPINTTTVPSAPGNLTDLSLDLVPGDDFDFTAYFLTYSTGAAGFKLLCTGILPGVDLLTFTMKGPEVTQTQSIGYIDKYRDATVVVRNGVGNNGNQSFNGFPASSQGYSYVEVIGGRARISPGGTATTLRWSFAQATGTGDTTSVIADGTKVLYVRRG